MRDSIAHFLRWTLTLCTPHPRGRHRAGTAPVRHAPSLPLPFTELLDVSAQLLVRPYVLDPEELRRQRARRRALYLATLGIDVGPQSIHGVRMAAR
ncbi:hypothetical protein OG453_00805 [Streptomyces sp. NBC_01381]|uniref:hypothetical protein n=1 Tax=Streptomyces sp. NBC_01381 TaxID=2903845 RepID=UPI0022526686|nr:hypothetical protein [Streptomyces sp. NBC_01381]MCX4665225.1 hypothetical protein [Streptomyces sp. NBC_01381]